jgi:hypothetical protein
MPSLRLRLVRQSWLRATPWKLTDDQPSSGAKSYDSRRLAGKRDEDVDTKFVEFAVGATLVKLAVETKFARLAVDTKFARLAVETMSTRLAVDTKFARFTDRH